MILIRPDKMEDKIAKIWGEFIEISAIRKNRGWKKDLKELTFMKNEETDVEMNIIVF